MATMTSFCRITGHARNLPKPCYFPLLPPLSPADAKKVCRITGRATDSHNYSPLIAFAKPHRFDGLEGCKITQYENLSFSRPLFIRFKDNEKSLDSLTQLLDKVKTKKKRKVDVKRLFVYKFNNESCGLVVPPELEEAIRTGEIETLSVSKDSKHISLKIKQGRTVKVQTQSIPKEDVNSEDNYYYGEGQSEEVLKEQQKILNERNKRKQETMARKRIFEMKEQKAEEDLIKDTVRPKPKRPPVKFDPIKQKEKLEKMSKMLKEQKENNAIILPKFEPVSSKANPDEQIYYEKMLEDIIKCQKASINVTTVFSSNFDWVEMEKAESAGFDWDSFPKEDICEPFEVTVIDIQVKDIPDIPENQALDIVASVEPIDPISPVEKEVLKAIKSIDEEKLKTTDKVSDVMKNMESLDILPTLSDVGKITSKSEELSEGYLVPDKDGKGPRFVKKGIYTHECGPAVSGAIVTINNEEKFIPGMFINLAKQETFVAGQTVTAPNGSKQFIPGQTVRNEKGELSFIPGQNLPTEQGNSFIAGHIFDSQDGPQFIAGQMIDLGDKTPVFMSGQTITTEKGPKFVPGEISTDSEGYHHFVPGIKMPSSGREKFIPGQAFQSEEGISFTPGQIIDTAEGPSFLPGKTFESSDGHKKFVRGEIVATEDGKISFELSKKAFDIPLIQEDLVETEDENAVIPNDDLQYLALTGKDTTGFVVRPTNTSNIQGGEKLYGDIVETDTSILFYLSGKLPKDEYIGAKIISGQLVVGETSQRFIPGKMMNTMEGEKFIPGQTVKTNQGEEFVPGQMVETTEGIKFIPGQDVLTSEGEKFIPGQVVLEENGPKFVPGQIIQTKNGATFIPGQMMKTEKGQKFVPGQLVDTKEGPMFVPGQVLETSEGPKFISGTVVEMEDGLKYLPTPNLVNNTEESEEESEFSFQGFDVSPEEILLMTFNAKNARPRSPLRKEQGLIDSSTLKKMAADTMVIHGRTPEPRGDKKKRKGKKGKITIDALENDEEDEIQIEDYGTDKIEVLKVLIKAGTSVSSLRKEKELQKLGHLLNIDEIYDANEAEIEAIKFINSSSSSKEDMFELYVGNDEETITDILFTIGNIEDVMRNDQVTNIVNDAIKKIITKKCDAQIEKLIGKINFNPESLYTDSSAQILLTDAVGIVCVTGDVEVASLLEKFISEPTNPDCLKENTDVLAVLRQVLVLHRVSERDPAVARALQDLRDDPEGMKDRNRIRRLIREVKTLLVRDKKPCSSFDVRHVTSSKDIPKEIFEQIRKDKDEADKFMEKLPDELFQAIITDERCGGKFIKSLKEESEGWSVKDIEKFKKGMAVVVAKDNMEAVIPKSFSRSIYYGIMPYLLIDEEGFKFFERGLTGRKLAPSQIIHNTWFQPDSYYEKRVLYPKRVTPSGMEYNLVLLGDSYRNDDDRYIHYTSLLPPSEPTRISYLDSQRRASREGSITPLRRSSGSATPRRLSFSAIHDPYLSIGDSYSRRGSMGHSSQENNSELLSSRNYTPKSLYTHADDFDQAPIKRSGTIEKLLNKYSSLNNYDEDKSPEGYEAYNPLDSHLQNGNEVTTNGHQYSSPSRIGSTSSITPDRLDDPIGGPYKSKFKDLSIGENSLKGKRTLLRPFSDIYETDEVENPITESESLSRYMTLEKAKKNYNQLESIYERSPSKEGKLSYTEKLLQWKKKQNKEEPLWLNSNNVDENRNNDNTHPSEDSSHIKSCRYEKDDSEDDSNDFSMEKFRESLRQKYTRNLTDINKTFKTGYSPSLPEKPIFEKARSKELGHDEMPTPRKVETYAGSRSGSAGFNWQNNVSEDFEENSKKGPFGSEYISPHLGEYRSPYAYGREYALPYEQPSMYGQTMGYGPQNTPSPYGYYNSRLYQGYNAPNIYGGRTGAAMVSHLPSYGGPNPGRSGGMYHTPMRRFSGPIGDYSEYGENIPSRRSRNMTYCGSSRAPNRRLTTPLNLSDDEDDSDLEDYDPRKGQRELASKIARKYVGDSDIEDD